MKRLLHIARLVKEYWMAVTIAVTVATTIATTAINMERKRVLNEKNKEDIRFIKDSTLYYLRQFDTRLYRIERKQDEMSDQITDQGTDIKNTQKSFAKYLSHDKSLTKDEFYYYMEIMQNNYNEIKKNFDINYMWTPQGQEETQ